MNVGNPEGFVQVRLFEVNQFRVFSTEIDSFINRTMNE
jgi:hypothetical protein